MAAKLEGLTLTVSAKVSESGKLFGSVTTIQVTEALEKAGFSIDRKTISIKDEIKELGSYKAQVKLHKEIIAELNLEVIAE